MSLRPLWTQRAATSRRPVSLARRISAWSLYSSSPPSYKVCPILRPSIYLLNCTADIGLKAAQLIAQSSSPLADIRKLSQDFPKYAYRLATSWVPSVNESLRAELEENNERYVEGGRSLVWLNGLPLTAEEVKPLRYVLQLDTGSVN